jgi:hypothetical protein
MAAPWERFPDISPRRVPAPVPPFITLTLEALLLLKPLVVELATLFAVIRILFPNVCSAEIAEETA